MSSKVNQNLVYVDLEFAAIVHPPFYLEYFIRLRHSLDNFYQNYVGVAHNYHTRVWYPFCAGNMTLFDHIFVHWHCVRGLSCILGHVMLCCRCQFLGNSEKNHRLLLFILTLESPTPNEIQTLPLT